MPLEARPLFRPDVIGAGLKNFGPPAGRAAEEDGLPHEALAGVAFEYVGQIKVPGTNLGKCLASAVRAG